MTNERKAEARKMPGKSERASDRLSDGLSEIEKQPVPDRRTQAALDLQKAIDAKKTD